MDSFSFDPPSRSPTTLDRDAGLPAHGYAPARGKVTQITNDNTGKVSNQTIVSQASPEFFKSPFESNRKFFYSQGAIQKLGKGSAPLAAGQVEFDECNVRQKRHDITCPATGRVHNQSVVSKGSPEWFKNSFKSNSEYFNTLGIVQNLRSPEEAQEYQRQAGLHGVPSYPKEKALKKMGMVHPVTGRCYNRSIVSVGVPAFMKGPYESNRQYFDSVGMTQALVNPPDQADGNLALGNRTQHVNPETGKVYNAQIVSAKSPHWMKQPFENNRAYFEKKGLVEKLHIPDLENLRYRPEKRTKEVWELRKCATSRTNKVSEEAPEWMTSPRSARASQCSRAESDASTTISRHRNPGSVRNMVDRIESRQSQKAHEKKAQRASATGTAQKKLR